MGMIYAIFKVKKSYQDSDFIDVKFLIDSGSVYSLVPKSLFT